MKNLENLSICVKYIKGELVSTLIFFEHNGKLTDLNNTFLYEIFTVLKKLDTLFKSFFQKNHCRVPATSIKNIYEGRLLYLENKIENKKNNQNHRK